jgi:hypothetical protein
LLFDYPAVGGRAVVAVFLFGAAGARAQAAGPGILGDIGCASGSPEAKMALLVDRTVYSAVISGASGFTLTGASPPIPGTSPVVAIDASCTSFAMLANGDVWAGGGPTWSYVGNMLGGATPAVQKSWGQLKAEHR